MSGKHGSSALNPEQGDWFKKTHGVRYLHVQTNANVASRKERRANAKFMRRRPDKGRLYGVPH